MNGVRFAASINHTPKPMIKIVTRIFIAVMTWLTWELSLIPITRMAVTAMITSTAMKSWEKPLRRGVERRWDRYAYELHDG